MADAPPTLTDDPPELNPRLDRTSLAKAFARTGRVHIPNVLTDASARRLFYALEHETPYSLIFNEDDKVQAFEKISEEAHQQAAIAAWQRAHSGFQYFHRNCNLLLKRGSLVSPDHYLGKLVAFLTSPDFLAFTRDVTGFEGIAWLTGAATLYKPLDFCTVHNDHDPTGKRLASYVLNMTPKWRPDWGGALQFFETNDRITEGYLPTFNALNLFRLPQSHAVGQVSMFGGWRYSVSGWLASD